MNFVPESLILMEKLFMTNYSFFYGDFTLNYFIHATIFIVLNFVSLHPILMTTFLSRILFLMRRFTLDGRVSLAFYKFSEAFIKNALGLRKALDTL